MLQELNKDSERINGKSYIRRSAFHTFCKLGFPRLFMFKKTDEKAEFIVEVRLHQCQICNKLTLLHEQALGPNLESLVLQSPKRKLSAATCFKLGIQLVSDQEHTRGNLLILCVVSD